MSRRGVHDRQRREALQILERYHRWHYQEEFFSNFFQGQFHLARDLRQPIYLHSQTILLTTSIELTYQNLHRLQMR